MTPTQDQAEHITFQMLAEMPIAGIRGKGMIEKIVLSFDADKIDSRNEYYVIPLRPKERR